MDLRYRAGRLAGVLILCLQLFACSYSVQSTRLQSSPPGDLPPRQELSETPFFPQKRYQCGPAALATVLASNDIQVQPDELVDKVYLPARQGSVPVEMEAAARSYGMLVYPLEPKLETLFDEVAAGHPVLVLQNLGFSWFPRWHYAVVVGYDLDSGEVVLRSGVRRRYRVSMGVFETTWRRADYWARVTVPAGIIPASAKPLPYVRAALALEQSHQQAAALACYRSATGRWPQATVAWLASGNLAYALGDYTLAEQSFRGGLEAAPQSADLWNNLGYVLAKRGCPEQAQKAVQCAIALKPDNDSYRESLHDIAREKVGAGGCDPVRCPVGKN